VDWVERKEVFLGSLKAVLSSFETWGVEGVKAETDDVDDVDDTDDVDDVEIWRVLFKVLDGLV
jgi:hypothetical protein